MIPEERRRHLRRLLNELRLEGIGDWVKTLARLLEQGETLSMPEVLWLQSTFPKPGAYHVVPLPLARFIAEVLRSREAMSFLDPAAGLGLLGAFVASQVPLERADLVCPCDEAIDLQDLIDSPRARLLIGDLDTVEPSLAERYDAIVSIPPFTAERQKRSYATASGAVTVSGDSYEFLLLEMGKRLSEDGMIACVMRPSFTWDARQDSVRQNLPQFGLYLTALIRLKPGTLTGSGVAFDLAIIERVDKGDLFVAEIPDDERAQDELITRLRNRTEGKRPIQGRLVLRGEYRGLDALESTDRCEKLGLRRGMVAVPFEKAVREVTRPRRRGQEFTRCEQLADAVYLPEMVSTDAATSQADLPERLKSYFQLRVNPEVVLPEYFAHWLNTPLGLALRQSTMQGTTIPRISKEALGRSILYLLPLDEQKTAMQALSTIQGLRSELSDLASRVWEQPRRVNDVVTALQHVNHEERFSDWLESLPFPLASILRAYHAIDRTDKERHERLLHFFEALAAFTATVHLSAFRSHETTWIEVKSKLAGALKKQSLSLKQATFGMWRVCLETLAVEARRLVHGKAEEQERAKALFHVSELTVIDALSSKKLLSILQPTNYYRNRHCHGGVVDESEATRRLGPLKRQLNGARELLGTKLLNYELLQAREMEVFPGPLYRCNVRRVMGSNPAFENRTVELITPAYTGALHLHAPGHDQTLELLPFVQLKHAPQPACYFFNRQDSSGTHFVSYHFAEKPDHVDDSQPFQDLFSELSEVAG